MASNEKKRVAVIGARGIGRHHANWWRIEGAEVCAVAGTTPESNAKTLEALEDMFGYSGPAYTDVAQMLRNESPDIVDICSPNAAHFIHAKSALEAGCDVLCEKPFLHDPTWTPAEMLSRARELALLAETKGLLLGMCSQYALAPQLCNDMLEEAGRSEPIRSLELTLQSPSQGRQPEPVATWIDLGPHLLAMVQGFLRDPQIDWKSTDASCAEHRSVLEFNASGTSGPDCRCKLTTGRTDGPPGHVRHIAVNDTAFLIGGAKGADGHFCASVATDGSTSLHEDLMRVLIRSFLSGTAVVDARASVRNLELLLDASSLLSAKV